ncbi:hypothetical protein ACA910_020779 [Epithemia clementina (nom. ined.)]
MILCRMSWKTTLLIAALFQSTKLIYVRAFDTVAFDSVVTKLKADAQEFAAEVERLYANRCNTETMVSCINANYGECQTKPYPQEKCLGEASYQIDACGSSQSASCGGLWDTSVSSVRIPAEYATGPGGNPTDPKLVESICFSRYLDEWFVQKHAADLEYWRSYGVEPRSMYFGSQNGAFRIYPARQSEECGTFDHRLRPWYVAGSSGPKNVVLILDTSGSMKDYSRIGLLKQAAQRIVSTLTVSDRILIVPFSGTAQPITTTDGYMFEATRENKEILATKIDDLKAEGSTKFYEAFDQAFRVVEKTAEKELTASCNTAILFLTDGQNTEGPDLGNVTALVDKRIKDISARLNKSVLLFTYSISDDDRVHVYPNQLACSVEFGLWSKISQDNQIVDSLSSYYRLFALGLGTENNKDFAAWVEPYQFQTGNAWGTTVSVPVYDRSKSPPLFLGVVGVDVSLEALDAALGANATTSQELRDESIRRIVEYSDASCPTTLGLSSCELEAYRAFGAPGDEAMCGVNCTGFEVAQVQEEACPTQPDYPKSLFVDGALPIGGPGLVEYPKRACCVTGNFTASFMDVCVVGGAGGDDKDGDDQPSIGLIVGVVVASVFVLCCCLYFICCSDGQSSQSNSAAIGTGVPIAEAWVPPPVTPHAVCSPINPAWVHPEATAPPSVHDEEHSFEDDTRDKAKDP